MAGDCLSFLACSPGGLRPHFAVGRRSAALHGLFVAIVCALASAIGCASAQAAGGTVTRTFSEEHSENSFVVPAGVESIKVIAIGGEGGATSGASAGGLGARVEGELSVTPGQTLYAEVGYTGGFAIFISRNGGGSSDLRTAPRADGLSPDDRVIVAGAGGGAGGESVSEGGGGEGGNAGDAFGVGGEGGKFAEGGEGGTLTGGGLGGHTFSGEREFECGSGGRGKLETGGEGGFCKPTGDIEGGQGGAGYYGGGGGAAGFSGGGGGGGSSLVPAGGSFSLAELGNDTPQVQISYTQPPNPPAAVTEAASEIRRETATMNATVNPEDEAVTGCMFEYGTSESYGSSAPCSPSPGSGIAPIPVSAQLTGLTRETIYHYRIVATNANGTSHGSDETFTTLRNEPPQVTEISPEAGPVAGGESVTISGSELEEATAVKFGSTPAKSFTVNSSESITAVSPAGTGTVSVSVTTPSGTSFAVHFTFLPLPTVLDIAPISGPAAGGTSVKISGSGFDAASTASFGASPASSVTFDSATELTAVAPPGAGTVFVTVTTPDAGTSADSEGGRFSYESGAPEFGRCVKQKGGVYANSGCTLTEAGKANYEWVPGPGPKNHFATTIKLGTKLLFESAGATKITCTGEHGEGEVSGTKTVAGVKLTLTGCTTAGGKVESEGLPEGEVITSALEGTLGVETLGITPAADKLALELHAASGQPFSSMGSNGIPIVVQGSVLVPVAGAKMVTSAIEKFGQKRGEQKPDHFLGGVEDEHNLEWSVSGGPFEELGLALVWTAVYEEKIEANPVA